MRARRAGALAGLVLLAACSREEYPRREPAPGAQGIAFAPNETCRECHAREYEEWLGSDHQLSMQPATPESVLGDFNDAAVQFEGLKARFFRKDGRYFVHTEGPDGEYRDFEIRYTFGVRPLQQYLVQFPGGRLQCLTIAWDTERRRWFSLYPGERYPPGDPLHWTGWSQRWNLMCAECHSTNLRKAYDAGSDTYRTAWDEINVSCQACHGPGQRHVEWARRWPEGYKPKRDELGLVVDFAAGDSRYQVDQCARCHSRRHQVSPEDAHGRPFMDDFQAATLREGLYYADGQILEEVYVYGSFLQSKMYRRGVRCTDCHNPHSLGFRRPGNALCTECHQPEPPQRFPTLPAKNYDDPSHHRHRPDSDAARCAACHMPERTYMVVDPRGDHSFRVPRPDLTVKLGVPNACNSACHQDRSPKWAAEWIRKWYGPKQAAPHWGEVIAAGRRGEDGAEAGLAALARDLNQPGIVRATAVELLRGYGEAGVRVMLDLLGDEDPLVRVVAAGGLETYEPALRLDAVAPLLADEIRAVRQEAARVLASVPPAMMSAAQRRAFEAALAEYRETQRANLDTPGARLNLGILAAAQGRAGEAIEWYRKAIELDPMFLPAQLNLATLYNQLGRNQEAEQVLREAIRHTPEDGELRYSLGLLLAEENRLGEAARSLGEAAKLLPGRARIRYNYGLALQHLGRTGEAERELLRAHETDPRDPDIVHALVILYLQQRRLEEAQIYAVKLAGLLPNQSGPRELLRRIEAELARRR